MCVIFQVIFISLMEKGGFLSHHEKYRIYSLVMQHWIKIYGLVCNLATGKAGSYNFNNDETIFYDMVDRLDSWSTVQFLLASMLFIVDPSLYEQRTASCKATLVINFQLTEADVVPVAGVPETEGGGRADRQDRSHHRHRRHIHPRLLYAGLGLHQRLLLLCQLQPAGGHQTSQ